MSFRVFALLVLAGSGGCQTWGPVSPLSETKPTSETLTPGVPGIDSVRDNFDRAGRFLTGKEQLDNEKAKDLYRQGDQTFRGASKLESDDAKKSFLRAGKYFARAAEAAPGSALQQDSLFMAGESYFFADRLDLAEDCYVQLQKEHPRSRWSDRAGKRLFAIGKYWIDAGIASKGRVIPVNFTDDTQPWLDSIGNGIRVLDQMRYDDPTSEIADDATMAQAMEQMRQENWFEADLLFGDVREIFQDSSHQFNAHKFGVRCKLEMYAGPNYSGLALDEAEQLLKRMRNLFPEEVKQPENLAFVENAEKTVKFLQAEKLWTRARYREKQRQFGGAAEYFQKILDAYPDTPFADQARERLEANADKPQSPPQRLTFLQKLFPSGQPQKPLLSRDGSVLR